jgi:hypothetical protein
MRVILILTAILLMSMEAHAQQQPDPAVLQRLLASTQAQRNQFLDALTAASVRVEVLTDDLTKAQARIKELEMLLKEKE